MATPTLLRCFATGMKAFMYLRRILYLAHLADGHEYDAAITLSREARLRSEALRVRGAWLFDGQRMCTLVSGTDAAIDTWFGDVRTDQRLRVVTVLFDGSDDSVAGDGRPARWQVGYCEAEDFDVFFGAGGVSGEKTLAMFEQLMAKADLRP